MIKSPCRNICKLDNNNVCIGCYRTKDEIAKWSRINDDEKKSIVEKALERRQENEIY